MQINHFINQRTILGFLLGIFLLSTISCESCTQKELERDKAPVVAQIEIEDIHPLGSINTTQLVVELSGKIKENNINDTSILGVLVVPTGESVEKAAKEFRAELSKSNKTLDKHTTHLVWSNQQCGAYYIAEISPNEKKAVSGKLFLQGELSSGKYQAYLMLHNLSYGTYTSKEGKEFEIPNIDPAIVPTVKIISGEAKRDTDPATGKPAVKIITQADADKFNAMQGGFLFIEKKDPKTNPIDLLSELIKTSKDLPVNADFQKVSDAPDVIIHSFNNGTSVGQPQANNNLDPIYTGNLFKKKSTYHVYAYLVGIASEGIRYIVSQEEKEITIPDIEVELEMKEAKIVKMIKSLDNKPRDINMMEISCMGNIKKQLGTHQPQVGFIFSRKKLDISSDLTLINDLLATAASVNGYHQQGENLAFLKPAPIAENLTGDIPYSVSIPEIPLELGKKYQVYFFLKDKGGDIFLSKEDVSLVVPNAELKINKFLTDKDGTEFLVEEDSKVGNEIFSTGLGQKTSIGYIIYPTTTLSIPQNFLEDLLRNINGKKLPSDGDEVKDTYQSQLGDINMVFMDQGSGIGAACKTLYSSTPDSTQFNLSFVFSCENAIFYKAADPRANPAQQFFWYRPDKVATTQADVNDGNPVQRNKYQYSYNGPDYNQATIYRIDGQHKYSVELNDDPTSPGYNVLLINEILSHVFQGAHATSKIEKFKSKMQKAHP